MPPRLFYYLFIEPGTKSLDSLGSVISNFSITERTSVRPLPIQTIWILAPSDNKLRGEVLVHRGYDDSTHNFRKFDTYGSLALLLYRTSLTTYKRANFFCCAVSPIVSASLSISTISCDASACSKHHIIASPTLTLSAVSSRNMSPSLSRCL